MGVLDACRAFFSDEKIDGDYFRNMRISRGLTFTKLTNMTGIPSGTLKRIEEGNFKFRAKHADRNQEYFNKLGDAYSLACGYLIRVYFEYVAKSNNRLRGKSNGKTTHSKVDN